jgi:hypothetical protein
LVPKNGYWYHRVDVACKKCGTFEYPVTIDDDGHSFIQCTNFETLDDYYEAYPEAKEQLKDLSVLDQIFRIVSYEEYLSNVEARHVRRAEMGWCQ